MAMNRLGPQEYVKKWHFEGVGNYFLHTFGVQVVHLEQWNWPFARSVFYSTPVKLQQAEFFGKYFAEFSQLRPRHFCLEGFHVGSIAMPC